MTQSFEHTRRRLKVDQQIETNRVIGSNTKRTEYQQTVDQQLLKLKQRLQSERTHLDQIARQSHSLLDRIRTWWKKEEALTTQITRLQIELDHLIDQVSLATEDQLKIHLNERVIKLVSQIQDLQMHSDEFAHDLVSENAIETEDLFPTEIAGAMKKWTGTVVERQGKLGKYGQDCARSNPETGTTAIADGLSDGVDSYEMARKATRRAQAILEDIPLESCPTVEEVQFYIQGELDTILDEVRGSIGQWGGTTLLASRFLEKFDALVMIDIGDAEVCAVSDGDLLPIKTVPNSMKSPPHIGMVGKSRVGFRKVDKATLVKVVSLREFRAAHPNKPVHLLFTTDGLKNTTGKSLSEVAHDIVAKGPHQYVRYVEKEHERFIGFADEADPLLQSEHMGSVMEAHPFEDDLTIVQQTIPAVQTIDSRQVAV